MARKQKTRQEEEKEVEDVNLRFAAGQPTETRSSLAGGKVTKRGTIGGEMQEFPEVEAEAAARAQEIADAREARRSILQGNVRQREEAKIQQPFLEQAAAELGVPIPSPQATTQGATQGATPTRARITPQEETAGIIPAPELGLKEEDVSVEFGATGILAGGRAADVPQRFVPGNQTPRQFANTFAVTAASILERIPGVSVFSNARQADVTESNKALNEAMQNLAEKIRMVERGEYPPELLQSEFIRVRSSLARLASSQKGLGKSDLRYWIGSGERIQEDIERTKEELTFLSNQFVLAQQEANNMRLQARANQLRLGL